MYHINKLITLVMSPAFVGACLFVAGFVVTLVGRRRVACWLTGVSLAWFLFWMSPATYRWLASGLEMQFPVMTVEETPQADAIRILGGGVGSNTNEYPYSEMWCSADRVWHGARLWKAGKAPRVFVTNESDIPLLMDFGVPRAVIIVCDKVRNTEEEARLVVSSLRRTMPCRCEDGAEVKNAVGDSRCTAEKPRVLLVTSAWHMRRAMLMFQRYAPEVDVIPAATDYEALVRCGWKNGLCWGDLIPNAEMMFQNSYMIKEIMAYWGYRFLRK